MRWRFRERPPAGATLQNYVAIRRRLLRSGQRGSDLFAVGRAPRWRPDRQCGVGSCFVGRSERRAEPGSRDFRSFAAVRWRFRERPAAGATLQNYVAIRRRFLRSGQRGSDLFVCKTTSQFVAACYVRANVGRISSRSGERQGGARIDNAGSGHASSVEANAVPSRGLVISGASRLCGGGFVSGRRGAPLYKTTSQFVAACYVRANVGRISLLRLKGTVAINECKKRAPPPAIRSRFLVFRSAKSRTRCVYARETHPLHPEVIRPRIRLTILRF